LHGSGPNTSPVPRAIINSRYAAPGHDKDPTWEYIPVSFVDVDLASVANEVSH